MAEAKWSSEGTASWTLVRRLRDACAALTNDGCHVLRNPRDGGAAPQVGGDPGTSRGHYGVDFLLQQIQLVRVERRGVHGDHHPGAVDRDLVAERLDEAQHGQEVVVRD